MSISNAAVSQETACACARWLDSVGVLANQLHVHLKRKTLDARELANALRDGVLLCNLLNRLSPGLVDPSQILNYNNESRLSGVHNLQLFLKACQTEFNLADHELFQPGLLYDMQTECVTNAIKLLSKISKMPKVQSFCKNTGFAVILGEEEEESFYETYAEDIYTPAIAVFDAQNDCYSKIMKGFVDVKNLWKLEQRDHVISELYNTEERFVETLNIILDDYMKKLELQHAADRHTIFSIIESCEKFHSNLQLRLRIAINGNEGRTVRVCHVFNDLVQDMLKVYIEYFSGLSAALSKIKSLEAKDAVFRQKLDKCQSKFKLTDLLLVPMQRSCKYHLLFKQLSEKTPNAHTAKKEIEKTIENLLNFSKFTDTVKNGQDNIDHINNAISVRIVDTDLRNSIFSFGWHLTDDNIRIREIDNTLAKTRFVILFDKALLICKVKANENYLKSRLLLSEVRLEDGGGGNIMRNNFMSTPEFSIVKVTSSKRFTFCFKNEKQKEQWKIFIENALKKISPPNCKHNNHDFQLFNFGYEMVECSVCTKLLVGIFYQGYRCQKCSQRTHMECIPKATRCLVTSMVYSCESKTSVEYLMPRKASTASWNVSASFVPFKVRAVYPYNGRPAPPDGIPALKFNGGDVILVVDDDDEDWWKGRKDIDGSEGYFASSFVVPEVSDQSLIEEKAIEEHKWYSDCDHGAAVSILERLQSSETVFLVRPRRDGGYGLSIKYKSSIGHIRIHSKENTTLAASKTRMFYVSDTRQFPSIQKLVAHYMENSLKESFPEWSTKLSVPFRDLMPTPIGQAIATADYKCTNNKLEIELKKDCKYCILTRDVIGWCLVCNKIGFVGYAPAKYLNEIANH